MLLSRNNQQDATLQQNLLFHRLLTAQHVSSGIPLIIRSSNCICSLWLELDLELLMMSGMLLETCGAVNERWNNKLLQGRILLVVSTESYCNARIHEY